MTAIVFLGPTLSRDEAHRELPARYLPPAAQGDVYRAAMERPFAIGIVDGHFESVPAVWHKEILWALSRGVHVFGAASMGALRAAELAAFGMRGVGSIFERFLNGELSDDDEVAVAHADETHGFRPASDAMVNIRASLADAVARGVLSEEQAGALVAGTKQLFYPERSHRAVTALAAKLRMPPRVVERLSHHFDRARKDVKRADAIAMLQAVKRACETHEPAPRPAFHLAHTDAWQRFIELEGRFDADVAPAGMEGKAR